MREYVVYPLSTRNLEEMMLKRQFSLDHSIINRWVITYSPQLEADIRASENADLDGAFEQIVRENSNYYLLGYTSTNGPSKPTATPAPSTSSVSPPSSDS